jgi:hypothetical protein
VLLAVDAPFSTQNATVGPLSMLESYARVITALGPNSSVRHSDGAAYASDRTLTYHHGAYVVVLRFEDDRLDGIEIKRGHDTTSPQTASDVGSWRWMGARVVDDAPAAVPGFTRRTDVDGAKAVFERPGMQASFGPGFVIGIE